MFTSDVVNLTPERIHLEWFSIFVNFDLILIFFIPKLKIRFYYVSEFIWKFLLENFNLVMTMVFWINRVAWPQAQLLFLQYFVIPVLFFDS